MCPDSVSNLRDKAWRILDYEVQMFLGIDHIRSQLKVDGSGEAQLIRNALVESSLLHIRILTDIFLNRAKWSDDIKLEQLGFDTDSDEPILAEKISALAVVYGEANDPASNCWSINKRLAHPTTHRTEGYDYSALFFSLNAPLRAVIEHVYDSAKRSLPFQLTS
jgi:hypothetical protein